MSLDVTDAPAPAAAEPPAPPPEPVPAVADPPVRPRARHRRALGAAELAERSWRPPLALAVAIFAACGPAHALGHTDLVYYAVLVALALSAVAVPLGMLALRRGGTPAEDEPEPAGSRP